MNRFVKLFILATAILVACNPLHDPDSHIHDEAESDLEGQAFTIHSQQLELFAEAGPWQEGKPIVILGHFTLVENGHHPLAEADIRLLLTTEGEVIQEVPGKQRIPGIFGFSLDPVSPMVADLVFIVANP